MHRISLTAFLLVLAPAVHAQDHPPKGPEWIISSSGSLTMIDGSDSQPGANLSITHMMGKTSIGLSGTLTASAGDAPIGIMPDFIGTGTLSAGHKFGRLALTGHLSAGRGIFRTGTINVSPAQRAIVKSSAYGYGAGILATMDFKLAKNLILTPNLEVDISKTRLTRTPLDRVTWPDDLEDTSEGVTLAGGGTLLHTFGKSRQHAILVMASVIRAANTSDFIHRAGRVDLTDIKEASADTFVDYGANISLGLSRRVSINLNATRSAGCSGAESTIAGAGLQFAF